MTYTTSRYTPVNAYTVQDDSFNRDCIGYILQGQRAECSTFVNPIWPVRNNRNVEFLWEKIKFNFFSHKIFLVTIIMDFF